MSRLTPEVFEILRAKTTMNRMSEGPAGRSHRSNSEVLTLFAEIDALRSELKEKNARIAELLADKNKFDEEARRYSELRADAVQERDELQSVVKLAQVASIQRYGFKNNWAGMWSTCREHGPFAWGGNWEAKENECPYCALEAALSKLRDAGVEVGE